MCTSCENILYCIRCRACRATKMHGMLCRKHEFLTRVREYTVLQMYRYIHTRTAALWRSYARWSFTPSASLHSHHPVVFVSCPPKKKLHTPKCSGHHKNTMYCHTHAQNDAKRARKTSRLSTEHRHKAYKPACTLLRAIAAAAAASVVFPLTLSMRNALMNNAVNHNANFLRPSAVFCFSLAFTVSACVLVFIKIKHKVEGRQKHHHQP